MDENLFEQKITRKQFLILMIVFVAGVIGLSNLLNIIGRNPDRKEPKSFSAGTFGGI